jgi:glycogen synthase
LRILMLSNLCPPNWLGGYEIAAFNVARALIARGHEVRLLTTPGAAGFADDAPFVVRTLQLNWLGRFDDRLPPAAFEARCHASFASNPGNTAQLLTEIARFRPDILYLWNLVGLGGLALVDAANQLGAPWVQHLMDAGPGEMLDAAHTPRRVAAAFGAADAGSLRRGRFVSMSRRLLAELRERYRVDLFDRSEIVPGWVAPPERSHGPYRVGGRTRFVTAGAVQAHKGIGLIVEAARRLVDEGHRDFEIEIYGSGNVPRFVAEAQEQGVADRIAFPGPRTQAELLDIFAERDCFLFPTWPREPFGFAPIEAAAAGCPPILTAECGAAERLVDGVHGWKIRRETAALTEAMRRVITGEADAAMTGALGAQLVREDLSFAACLDLIEAILERERRPWAPEAAAEPAQSRLVWTKHELSEALRFRITP